MSRTIHHATVWCSRPGNPTWGRRATIVLACVCALALPAAAQPKGKQAEPKADPPKAAPADPKAAPKGGKPKEQNFNFDGLGIQGKNRSPQLLYFLERANEELERASLEKRSFIPRLVQTVEEEAL